MQFAFLFEIHSEKEKTILVSVLILVDFDAGVETSTSGPVVSSGPPLGAVRLAQEKMFRAKRGNSNSNCLIFISQKYLDRQAFYKICKNWSDKDEF